MRGLLLLVLMLVAAASLPAQTEIYRWTGENPFDMLGRSVAGPGDLSGDHVPDIVVGVPGWDNTRGLVRAYSGADGSVLYETPAPSWVRWFGQTLEVLGDVDGDSVSDYLAGGWDDAYFPDPVNVVSGATGMILYGVEPISWPWNTSIGYGLSLASLGDITGDAVPDFAVGAPLYPDISLSRGAVYVYSGADGSLLYYLEGQTDGDAVGSSLVSLGDVDGDGRGDLLVGATENITDGLGYVTLYSGRTGRELWTVVGRIQGERFGRVVNVAGDIDGDGVLDALVGGPDWKPAVGSGVGAVYLLSGVDGRILRTTDAAELLGIGNNIGEGTDLNGDGRPELLLGAHTSENAQGSGSVIVLDGCKGAELYRVFGLTYNASLGAGMQRSIVPVGDLDSDGHPDFAVGAHLDQKAFPQAGMVRVFLGWADVPILTLYDYKPGQDARIEVTNLAPHTTAWVAWSKDGGGPTPSPLGDLLLTQPIHKLAPLQADASGVARATIHIPAGAWNERVWSQAYGRTASGFQRLSNGRESRIY